MHHACLRGSLKADINVIGQMTTLFQAAKALKQHYLNGKAENIGLHTETLCCHTE